MPKSPNILYFGGINNEAIKLIANLSTFSKATLRQALEDQ